jgi:molecular chaperone GrpE
MTTPNDPSSGRPDDPAAPANQELAGDEPATAPSGEAEDGPVVTTDVPPTPVFPTPVSPTPVPPMAEAEEAAAEIEEDLQLAVIARERDDYLDALRRLQADFENYKKRMIRQQTEHLERAAQALVEKLLPVFDTTDLAVAHGGGEEVKQIWTALFDTLEREGLERIDPLNVPFDPTVHEAVAHEPGDGSGQPEVVEVMRAGYRWKGRVLRPAMVKVRG